MRLHKWVVPASALDELVARHEAFRTRVVAVDGVASQRIGPPDSGFALVTQDLTGRPDADAWLADLQRREFSAEFDLSGGPLARGRLVVLGAEHHVLLLTVHHVVFDGWTRTG
ncbi:MAG: hypothetical protein QOG76_2059 [Pseudonocardiales bacterium]|nr:hypothetical protein [Pseudonocardiales bacterium]